ncbi:HAD domain-containing protein [Mesorhizobium sp. RP14(2022)]|uniref:HAD domain-containing protein n=1 Tax=Mesorhizobium liriopis TaxID=2953882 RepID=A0ABT1C7M8_9HYPH|nr:HAD domain-containing protein [Mesorhizobium liriopis]MCO6050814.1 HAD domain-containing protein [Mesorhizobium liriopis]
MGERVLFLDVDGVLNHDGVFGDWRFGPLPLDHTRIALVHEVVKATGCKIVLSSAWRGMPDLERKLAADFMWEVFVDLGKDRINCRHEDGSTIRSHDSRGHQIEEWLSRHPEIEAYAIVDDDCDMLPEQRHNFVRVPDGKGLKPKHRDKLIEILSAA